jgi:methyl-accepting chemotaxis protein
MSGVKRFLGHVYENYMYKISIKLRLRIMIYLILVNVSGLGFYTFFQIKNIDNDLERLSNRSMDIQDDHLAVLHQNLLATQEHLAWVTFFILFIGAVYSFFILRSIISPIENLRTRVLEIVDTADLSQRIDHQANDELGAMMRSMDTMLEKFQGITREVNATTGKVMGSMGEMSVIADETDKAVSEQQDSFNQVAALVEQIAVTVADISSKVELVAGAAEQADDEARSGREVVEESIRNIENLASEVERANVVIQSLDERGKSIGTVVDLIRDVAEQTNLLALNAAIEAARAGEQGRGFAVVADEVRNLASRTQDATQEIQKTIEVLQKETTDAAHVMDEGRRKAEYGVKQVIKAGEFLEAITRDVSSIKKMLEEINDATTAQDTMTADVGNSIEGIQSLFVRTGDHARQTATASHELTKLSEQLDQQVSQFKI